MKRIDFRDERCMKHETYDLTNQEQIDAAVKLGIFEAAVVLSRQSEWATNPSSEARTPGPYTYEQSGDSIYVVGPSHGISQEDAAKLSERVIESSVLQGKLANCVIPMLRSLPIENITEHPYILDIDLDAFQTRRAVNPTDRQVFYELIRGAAGITIACERWWVNKTKREPELTSDYLLDRLLEHIDRAQMGEDVIMRYEHELIEEKNVFTVDDHASAILAWAKVKRENPGPLYLVSLDYHSDDREAFKAAFCQQYGCRSEDDNYEEFVKERLDKIDISNEQSIRQGLVGLKNDEHIDAAIRLGILDGAIVICLQHSHGTDSNEVAEWRRHQTPLERLQWQRNKQRGFFRKLIDWLVRNRQWSDDSEDPKPLPPYTYSVPDSKIFQLDPRDVITLPQHEHIQDHIIEAWVWKSMIDNALNPMAQAFGYDEAEKMPYVFDVDLDVFATKRAINPRWSDWFYGIVSSSSAISIAREPRFVDILKREDDLTVEYLEQRLKQHIKQAITQGY